MTEGMNGMNCETGEPISCISEAVACATLTDNSGAVIAHKFLCEYHALGMFAIKVNLGNPIKVNFEEKLDNKVKGIMREQNK